VPFDLIGAKLIGTNPDTVKYSASHTTGLGGSLGLTGLEWDTYTFTVAPPTHDLRGTIPLSPIGIAPNSNQNLTIVLTPRNSQSLLVTVRDTGTQLPISDATVVLSKAGFSETLLTNRGFLRQTDWSGGGGQELFVDNPAKFFSSDGNIEVVGPAGEIRLRDAAGGGYVTSGELISSTFDTGSGSNFFQLSFEPQAQPPNAGANAARFQIATNNDETTWTFLGPDGTANTYYTIADTNISGVHDGDRYLRYRVLLATVDPVVTPSIADIAIMFTAACVPPGQVLFQGLANDSYTLDVSKAGYQNASMPIDITAPFKQQEVFLAP
jgi:hypothetical protein